MSDGKICVSCQRTAEDVATELTIAYMENASLTPEKIAEIYKLFYKNAIEAINGEF